jgi:hypothetical protein
LGFLAIFFYGRQGTRTRDDKGATALAFCGDTHVGAAVVTVGRLAASLEAEAAADTAGLSAQVELSGVAASRQQE